MLQPMDVNLAVLADAANATQDGKLNILGAFNTIWASRFPATHPTMQLVVKFTASPAERGMTRRSTLKLIDADGKELLTLSGDITVPDKPGADEIGIVTILALNNVRFEHPGDYSFRILLDNDERQTIPFKVVQRDAPERSG